MKILIWGGSNKNEFRKTVLERKVPVWGAKPTIGNAKKLSSGDLVCFFSKGKIDYVAEVKHIEIDRPDISLNIWKSEQWTTIIYLRNIVKRDIKWEVIREILGYKKTYVGLRSPVLLKESNMKFHKMFPLLKKEQWFKKQIKALDDYSKDKPFTQKDFDAINALKRKVGLAGELYIVEELKKLGKRNIVHYSKKYPFAPYDIHYEENGQKKYIEVKSTIKTNLDAFYISYNEYKFYNDNKQNYSVFLVNDVYNNKDNKSYTSPSLENVLVQKNMQPISYKVKV